MVELTETLRPLRDLFDADLLDLSTLFNARTGQRGLYALPMGRISAYVHVWSSLLEPAGLSLEDIPEEWEAFWTFWCDRVQPAVRRATGRDDIWGVGLPMGAEGLDNRSFFNQFQHAGPTARADSRSMIPACARDW